MASVDEDLPFILDGRTLAAGDSFTFVTDAGSLDVLGTPSGTAASATSTRKAPSYDLGDDLSVRVVALDDLMRMKRGQRPDQGQDAPRGAHRPEARCIERRRNDRPT